LAHGDVWRRLAARVPTLRIIEAGKGEFLDRAALDIEIMATSMVVMKFDKKPPYNDAGCYQIDASGWAKTVVVPPVYSYKDWPSDLPPIEDDSEAGRSDYFENYGYEFDLHNWTKVLSAVSNLRQGADLRVGFHCDTIGYFKADPAEVAQAFEQAYAGYLG
jgi:hypothetical protein